MQYQFIFFKIHVGNLSHRGKVSKETEIVIDRVLHHFWSKPVDLRAFLPRPAPRIFTSAPPRPAEFCPRPAPPRPAEIWAAPIACLPIVYPRGK